jgi:hypothetical protein
VRCGLRRIQVTVTGILLLVGVGVAAGLVSTVAGVASFVSYPALLAFGLPPLSANMTNTVALLFTGAGAAAGSRPELAGQGARIRRLGLIAALGGGAGAALLLVTPADTFERTAPVLIGGASLVLLAARLPAPGSAAPGSAAPDSAAPDSGHSAGARGRLLLGMYFCVAMYVGYFGAAGGVLMLAALLAMLAEPIARVNAVKNVTSGFTNLVAAVTFAVFGQVDWAVVPPLAAGFLAGGWLGPALVRRLPARVLRVGVGICGLAVGVKLALTAYR